MGHLPVFSLVEENNLSKPFFLYLNKNFFSKLFVLKVFKYREELKEEYRNPVFLFLNLVTKYFASLASSVSFTERFLNLFNLGILGIFLKKESKINSQVSSFNN